MKNLREKHEACIRTNDLIVETERIVNEMILSNERNEEQGLKTSRSEAIIKLYIIKIKRLKKRYIFLTSKL